MSTDREHTPDTKIAFEQGTGHGAGGFASSTHMQQGREMAAVCWVAECPPDGAAGTGMLDARRANRVQVVPERMGRQWALCGSDQAESRVTRSNSRSSLATT